MSLSDLSELATNAEDLRAYRTGVLRLLERAVRFDAAIYHAFSATVPIESAVIVGLDPAVVGASVGRWDEFGSLFGALRERANRDGVATLSVLPRAAFKAFLEQVARPFGQRDLCMCHLIVRGQVVAAIALFARREKAFAADLDTLRAWLPTIAVGDALHQWLDDAPRETTPTRLACTDQRLTARQREIMEYVALGHTNAEIGAALGLATHSVRNHLVRVFSRVGASNRADAVRLAVLRQAGPPRASRKRVSIASR